MFCTVGRVDTGSCGLLYAGNGVRDNLIYTLTKVVPETIVPGTFFLWIDYVA